MDFCVLFIPLYFNIPNNKYERLGATKVLYTWDDQNYRDFMLNLLRNLEPRTEPTGTVIYRTLEEVEEIYFIEKGSVDIGFEINRITKFIFRLHKGGVVGAYNMTFNTKTMFFYQVKQTFTGLTIRKDNWNNLMNNEEYIDITSYIKTRIQTEY